MTAQSWNSVRTRVAFLVAPLAVPSIAAAYAVYHGYSLIRPDPLTLLILYYMGLVAYGGAFVFGVPIYRYLLARKLTAFWIGPAIGFMVATLTWFAFLALVALVVGGVTSAPYIMGDAKLSPVMWFSSLSGVVVGTMLWLIARPDRQTQSGLRS